MAGFWVGLSGSFEDVADLRRSPRPASRRRDATALSAAAVWRNEAPVKRIARMTG
jgi:hypothetical protein